jgi:serine/threonine protein kinase
MELRLNLITILDTLDFLHNTVKTVHLAINMDNIYITNEGKWKIGGLSLSQIYAGEGLQNISDFKCDDLTYCAPEVALEQKFDRTADIYSLGVLVLDLLMIINDNFVT